MIGIDSDSRSRLADRQPVRGAGYLAFLIFVCCVARNGVADAIHDAAEQGDISQVQALLDAGVAPGSADENGNTALHIAASNGHVDLAEYLLSAGTTIDATNNAGLTAMMLAESRDHYELARWFILQGAACDVAAEDGSTALSSAWKKEQWEFIRFLVTHGADPEEPIHSNYPGGAPPLIIASYYGDFEMVEWLLEQGVDVNAKSTLLGMSALYEATRAQNIEIARLLLEHGADVESGMSVDGTTPLHAAVAVQNLDEVRLLIEFGADVNAHSIEPDDNWRTPLTLAQYKARKHRRSDDPIVALLLQHGAKSPHEAQETERSAVCYSEKQVRKMNGFRSRDRMARYVGTDARLFVELVLFWEFGEWEPIDYTLYDTAIVWTLQRVQGVQLAPLILFRDGCALDKDFGLIQAQRVDDYKKTLGVVRKGSDPASVRSVLLELAEGLKAENAGVYTYPHSREMTPEELVSEFEIQLQQLLLQQ
jgi:ankyrin repeat protein